MEQLADKIIVKSVRDKLIAHKQTIAVSESVTAGLLQAALASAQDASLFFQGGITAYNIGQKARHLGINAIHATECDCVSSQIAEQMAVQAVVLFTSDWAIGITGYATPSPASGNKVFCYYAICYKGKIIASKRISAKNKDPLAIQLEYIGRILKELSACLGSPAAKHNSNRMAKKRTP